MRYNWGVVREPEGTGRADERCDGDNQVPHVTMTWAQLAKESSAGEPRRRQADGFADSDRGRHDIAAEVDALDGEGRPTGSRSVDEGLVRDDRAVVGEATHRSGRNRRDAEDHRAHRAQRSEACRHEALHHGHGGP